MAHPSDPALLVLHALRLKGFAEDGMVATISGLAPSDVATRLQRLAADGLVAHREGRVSGWSLTASGRACHASMMSDELNAAGARDTVKGAYERFLEINQDMLAVCTAWQLREGESTPTINDHTDAGYDERVVNRLIGIHDRVRPVVSDLRDALDRFATYGVRLRGALEKVVAGEHEWFTKPVIDSYHTVWFELHEDLLSTLGVERSSEGQR